MIRRIELQNFMSHEHTVLLPSPGLTVLVGPNNCGKSAVVVALQILAHNDTSTYVMRHGTKHTSIVVETDDGNRVEWHRKRGGPFYLLNGERYDRLNQSVPAPVRAALRLPTVTTGTDGAVEFDLHFGSQKSPVFLLDQPGSVVAQFFASSSDAEKLVRMQQLHREKSRHARSELERLRREESRVQEELEQLAPAADLANRARAVEEEYQAIQELQRTLEALSRTRADLQREQTRSDGAAARGAALRTLSPPPVLHDTTDLAMTGRAITRAAAALESAESRYAALRELAAPPPLHDTAELRLQIAELHSAHENVVHARQHAKEGAESLALARAELSTWIDETGRCPHCGGELSLDHVLAAATGELGGTDE